MGPLEIIGIACALIILVQIVLGIIFLGKEIIKQDEGVGPSCFLTMLLFLIAGVLALGGGGLFIYGIYLLIFKNSWWSILCIVGGGIAYTSALAIDEKYKIFP